MKRKHGEEDQGQEQGEEEPDNDKIVGGYEESFINERPCGKLDLGIEKGNKADPTYKCKRILELLHSLY